MFMDFRGDKFNIEQLHNLDTQFMLGSNIMASPVVTPGERKKKTYFPDELFYNFYTGEAMNPAGEITLNVEASLNTLPLFLRAGFITPIQDADNSITKVSQMRKKPLEIIIALDANNQAAGRLFFDDGESDLTLTKHEYYRMDIIASQTSENFYEITFKYFNLGYIKGKPS
jgi:alpha-glucosidase (family GH31 glycosyl hydrolase)